MKIPKVILRIEASRACGRGILLGIGKYCKLYGPWKLSQKPPFYLGGDHQDNPNLLENWVADGMIVSQPDIPRQILETGLPIIGIDVRITMSGFPNIVGDAEEIARMAIEHFAERGFTNFAYCGFENIDWACERGDWFNRLQQERGFQVHNYYHNQQMLERLSWDEQLNSIAEWLKTLPRPLALFACNDDFSKMVAAASQQAQLRVPDEGYS